MPLGFRPLDPRGLFSRGAVVLLLAAAASCTDRLPDQDLRILSTPPFAKLSADLLWKEYQSDARAAGRAYRGRAIEVTGVATQVGDPADQYLLFGQSGELGVRAQLLDEQAADILGKAREDPRITLKCFCEGLSGNVVLKSCVSKGS